MMLPKPSASAAADGGGGASTSRSAVTARSTLLQVIHILGNFMRIWSVYSLYNYLSIGGDSIVGFIFSCLVPTSIIFLVLQKPWKGWPFPNSQVVPTVINGGILVLYFVMWGKGFLACGPLVYFGALVGRVANRIAKARFVLDGKVYHLYANDGKNALHGGHRGFSKVIWTVNEYVGGGDSPYITLYYRSFDGEQGFPGDLDVYVTYQLSSPYVLSVHMNATALDKATPVNLAQHTYWNLGGHGSGDVLGNTVQLFAFRYTPVDGALIPTGELAPVAGTPYDLRAPTPVGAHVHQVTGGSSNGSTVYGYDMNYAVDGDAYALRRVAAVRDGASGRALELWTNQPGVQFYTGNFLKGVKGKGGKVYGQYGALCLETQVFPDAVNHPNFPSQIVRPGQVHKHDMVFKFSF